MGSNTVFEITRLVIGDTSVPFEPSVNMSVYYNNNLMINGRDYRAPSVATAPRVSIGGNPNELYALVLIDPDAPNPNEPFLKEVVSCPTGLRLCLLANARALKQVLDAGVSIPSSVPSCLYKTKMLRCTPISGAGASVHLRCPHSRVLFIMLVLRVSGSLYYENRKVTNGCELHTLTAQTTPRVVIGGKGDEKYTLIMSDSDDPNYNEQSSQENLSWLVINKPGGTTCAQGTQVFSYKGPGHPGVGVHRCRFVLYKQEEKIEKLKNINILLCRGNPNELYALVLIDPDAPNPNEPFLKEVVSWIVTNIPGGSLCGREGTLDGIETPASRTCFNARAFASKHNLSPVGLAYYNVRREPRKRKSLA
nr:hypothetical protein [Tanacetum cinerariifolium]